jgi:hypothetical protein
MTRLLPFLALLFALSCATRRPTFFQVLPAQPNYLLRSPDLEEIPFPEVPGRYTDVGPGWVDLQAEMGLQVENAYFKEGAPRHGLAGFIGTEVAQYRARTGGGLRLISVESNVAQRPKDQPPVSKLIPVSVARYRYHRLFYQVIFRSKGATQGAVLLGAGSKSELEQLGAQLLTDPDSVCSGQLVHCTVFPEACSVSVEMEIFVNGSPRSIIWGSLLASVAAQPRGLELLRRYAGHLAPVKIDSTDLNALRLPLLPGDRVTISDK